MSSSDLAGIFPRVIIVSRRSLRKNKFVDFVGEYHLDLIVGYGAVPVIVPRVAGVHTLLNSFEPIHGVLLCEGEDIDPSLYEAEETGLSNEELEEIRRLHVSDTTIDKEKDTIELSLAKICLERNIPYLGICRGSQVLNVACGGTLYQDIGKELTKRCPQGKKVVHMDYDNYDGHRHAVKIVEETPLHEWFKDSLKDDMEIQVNSYHHQGVKRLAQRFKPMACQSFIIIIYSIISDQMASSNRHWPSMFKSKPTCNTRHHHQWHSSNDNNTLLSSASPCTHRSPYTSGCEERSPEPKPRWNPKPEQIRILETIFNSGMVNPPREEIRKIRAQLQEYGQVGDANVFYWFQNRKSRSKHKTRHLQKSQNHQSPVTTKVTTASSSSSSEKSYSKSIDFLLNSPTASVNQHFGGGGAGGGGGGAGYHHHVTVAGFSPEQPFSFPAVQQPPVTVSTTTAGFTEGFWNVVSQGHDHGNLGEAVGSGSGMLLTDLLMMNQQSVIQKMNDSKGAEEKTMKVSSYNFTTPPPPTSVVPPSPTTTTVPSTISDIQGVGEPMPSGKSTVFINDVAFEVAVGPFNVREAFGDDAVLIHSYGQPVVTNEWGVTLQSLQHGAFYYLVRSFSCGQSSTIDLI